MDDNYKNKIHVKRYVGETKWMYFLIEDNELLKNIMIFGKNSAIVLKKNLIGNPSTIKTNSGNLRVMELQIFMMKICLK